MTYSKSGGFRVVLARTPAKARAVRKATPAEAKSVPVIKAKTKEQRLDEILDSLLDLAEKIYTDAKVTMFEAAARALRSEEGAKLAKEHDKLSDTPLRAEDLAKRLMTRLHHPTRKGAADLKLDRVLADLETISKIAEAEAQKSDWRTVFPLHERAAEIIRDGGPLSDAIKILRGA